MSHLKYLWYLLCHKWYVVLACWRYGCFRRAFTHDLSKFLPSEWFAYTAFFYGAWRDKAEKDPLGHARMKATFDLAWLHHQHRNLHHWQYWLLRRDDGTLEALEMPEVYTREMVADWTGAGMAIHGRDECVEWYLKNREKMHLHPKTQAFVEELLGISLKTVTHEDGCCCSACNILGTRIHNEQ